MRERALALYPLLVGLCLLCLFIAAEPRRPLRGHNDFVQLYAGAQLAGSPGLYDREANLELIRKTHGFTMETVVYTRPPFYARLLKPLGWLPYLWAYGLYSALGLGIMVWFVARFRGEAPGLPVLAGMGLPLVITLVTGQDTAFVLLFLALGIMALRAGRDVAAGVCFALLAIKFHLFAFLPLPFLLRRRWGVLQGGAMAGVAMGLLGGWEDLVRYVGVLRDPWIHYSAVHMPNLHGLAANLGWGPGLEWSLYGALLVAFVGFAWWGVEFERLLAMALVAGLLVSYHSGIADEIVLYAAYVLLAGRARQLLTLMLTPVPFVMVMVGPPWSMVMPVMLVVLFVLTGIEGRAKQ